MRYRPEHKAEVHANIVKDASRRIRNEGLKGAEVASVMRDNRLTHGGFYKHFANKEELLIESLQSAFREITSILAIAAQQAPAKTAWKAIVTTYLSPQYRDHIELGCPLTALAPELARADKRIKQQILAELVNYKAQMQRFMPGRTAHARERAFFSIFSTLIGAVQLARLMPDPQMREKVLAIARDSLLKNF